jgi:long-chain acyl-CoA synthetase
VCSDEQAISRAIDRSLAVQKEIDSAMQDNLERPWEQFYRSESVEAGAASLVEAWAARVDRAPDAIGLAYFDGTLTARQADADSDALAVSLSTMGVSRGDRIGIYLQNIPQYPLLLLALWKLGAAALLLNPMYRRAELRRLIDDSGATGIVCADVDVDETAETVAGSSIRWIVSTSSFDYQRRNDPRVFKTVERARPAADGDLGELIERSRGQRPTVADLEGSDVALLTYTSGTTGPPKGAMNTHANLLAVTDSYASWVGLEAGDAVFATAPFFHITGAVLNATLALLHDSTLVMVGRFDPDVALDAFVEHRVTFTIGSITAFNAIQSLPRASREHFSSFKAVYSGGAPIPPATLERFRQHFGVYIHNVYGMTETSSAVIAVPLGVEAPIHGPSGTLSIGVPLPLLDARIVTPRTGELVPYGEQGELELTGPQIIPGYWHNPEATASTLPSGHLRTGDGAIMDEAGWVYLVDRLKDQINTSGYKVWPREVEDALYEHAAVREAAVIGVPDDYRGEAVTAFVSLVEQAAVTEDELIAFARDRLAAYKAPRSIHFVAELPKTQTGKIQRNILRSSS